MGYVLAKCLERHDPMNTVCAEDAELAFIVAAEIDQAAAALAGAGQRYLVDGANALPIFIFKQHHRLAGHRCGQAQIGELDNLAKD